MRTTTTLLALALSLTASLTQVQAANPLLSARQLQLPPPGSSCPTCNPSPLDNHCDPTTSCTAIGSAGQTFCACRAGYRAADADVGNTSVQWQLPVPYQEGRVFVAPYTACDTLCNEWELGKGGCGEVQVREDCLSQ